MFQEGQKLYQHSIFSRLNIIEDIPVEGIKFDEDSISLHIGETKEIKATVFPKDAIHQDVIYESKDPDICLIDSTGCISALSIGKTIIYAFSHNKQFVDSCIVSVFEHTTGIIVDSSVRLRLGDEVKLNSHTLPEESDGSINWKSSNEDIAIVYNSGVVKGINLGNCIVTATSVDGGYTADCFVTVVQPVDGVTLEKHNLSLNVGESEQLYANVHPVNADNRRLIWSTSDFEVAEVDADGNVTAKKRGIAFVKATSEDNPFAVDSCKVIVNQPVTGITLNYDKYGFNRIGATTQFVATISPEDASNKDVIWRSSNESICFASNGTIVSTGYGTCVVIATTVDGGYLAFCTIDVYQLGDINHDGVISISDVTRIINILLTENDLEYDSIWADMNNDGIINIRDVTGLINQLLSNSNL